MRKSLSILTTGIFLTLIIGCQLHLKAPQDTAVLENLSQDGLKSEWKYALRFTGKRWYVSHPVGWLPDRGK